jgi:hypothetical protein
MFEDYSRNQLKDIGAQAGPCRPPSVIERLTDEKERCERRLAEVNGALALLDQNPGVATVLEALSKIGF